MGSPLGRVLVGVLAIVVAAALFFVLRDDDDDDGGGSTSAGSQAAATTTTAAGDGGGGGGGQDGAEKPETPKPQKPEVPTIVVEGGEPVGGVQELSFEKGEDIRFVVESDVADHVHLHGYDVQMDVPAGGRVEFDVPATLDGVFEVELEDRIVPLAEITVEP